MGFVFTVLSFELLQQLRVCCWKHERQLHQGQASLSERPLSHYICDGRNVTSSSTCTWGLIQRGDKGREIDLHALPRDVNILCHYLIVPFADTSLKVCSLHINMSLYLRRRACSHTGFEHSEG